MEPDAGHPPSRDPADDPGATPALRGRLRSALRGIDRFQRRHRAVAIAIAVLRKFADDRAGRHAALVAYYAFFSLFPLLLVLVTVLGFALEGDPELRERVLGSALAQFPIIGEQIRDNLRALTGSLVTLSVGLAGAVWSGLGVVAAVQDAMNEIWNVERREQASFARSRLRALMALVVLGVAVLAAALLAGLGTSGGWLGTPLRALAFVGTVGLNIAVFAATFRWLTDANLGWRNALPGAVVAGIVWAALLVVGSWLVDRQIREASQVYGFFGLVLGLLGWIYLAARMMLLAAELNVVLARRLWPRSLPTLDETTEPDRRVLAGEAREEAAHPDERVDVRFDRSDRAP